MMLSRASSRTVDIVAEKAYEKIMLEKERSLLVVFLMSRFWALGVSLPSGAAGSVPSSRPQAEFGLEHTPIVQFDPGQKLVFKATVRGQAEWVTLYYRPAGVSTFQARPMARAEPSAPYMYEFDPAILTGRAFEYYLEAEQGGRRVTIPDRAPEELIRSQAAGGEAAPPLPESLPAPEAELTHFAFAAHANGTFESSFAEMNSAAGAVDPTANGNFRVTVETRDNRGLGLTTDANFALSNMPPSGGEKIDLSNMMITLAKVGHAFRAGDLLINESEYTTTGFNRRGVEYAFESPTFTLHAFDVNSQLLRGFKGVGVPPVANNVFGASAGIKLLQEAILLKAVFLTGTDDPSQAGNLGVSSSFQARKGNVVSVIGETRLFKNAFNLRGEFALSNYDSDVNDEGPRAADQAYSLGAGLAFGGLNVTGVYRFVGRSFNSIGLQYLANDRKGFDAGLQFAMGRFSLQAQFNGQENNVEDDPAQLTTRGLTGNAMASLALVQAVTLTAGYRILDQKSYQSGLETAIQDTATNEGTAGLVLNVSTVFSLNASGTVSRLRSRSYPSGDTDGLTVNVGTMVRLGEMFNLAPTLGLSRTKTVESGDVNTTLSGFLTGEIFVIRKVLSLQFAGSYNRMTATVMAASRSFEVLGGVNFYLGQLLKIGQFLVAAKGQLRETEMNGMKVRMTRVLAQANLAF